MAYVLGPKNFMRGERNDDARLKKLELQYAALLKRIETLESEAAPVPLPERRGPGRPRKDAA